MFRVDLLTIGEAFEDLIFLGLPRLPRPGEEVKTDQFVRTVGGGAVITAVAAARLGLRCRILSALSPAATELLRAEKVSLQDLRRREEPYAVTAAISTKRDRSYVTFNGVNEVLESRLLKPSQRAAARHVHFAFYPGDCKTWALLSGDLRRRGISTSWDFGWNEGLLDDGGFEDLIRGLDYLFLNEKEALLYSGRRTLASAMSHWRHQASNTIVKLGRRGSSWIGASQRLAEPAPSVRTVDTTGAGDAFNGGFLYGVLNLWSPQECLRMGNWVGARSTRAAGGISALPHRAEYVGAAPSEGAADRTGRPLKR